MRVAFYDLKEFPVLLELAQAWATMRQDLDVLAAPLMDVDRVGKSHERVGAEIAQRVEAGEPFGWVRGWGKAGGNPAWTQYGLILGDRVIRYASAPRTLALLAPLRGIKVAAFVRLAPGTLLPVHTHPEVAPEGLLQMHVTLKAPKPSASCLLNVAGEIRQHVIGGTLVFDGSLPHWAVNASAEDRVILYLEFHRATHHRPRLNESSISTKA
jgi:beta-hydroxylase